MQSSLCLGVRQSLSLPALLATNKIRTNRRRFAQPPHSCTQVSSQTDAQVARQAVPPITRRAALFAFTSLVVAQRSSSPSYAEQVHVSTTVLVPCIQARWLQTNVARMHNCGLPQEADPSLPPEASSIAPVPDQAEKASDIAAPIETVKSTEDGATADPASRSQAEALPNDIPPTDSQQNTVNSTNADTLPSNSQAEQGRDNTEPSELQQGPVQAGTPNSASSSSPIGSPTDTVAPIDALQSAVEPLKSSATPDGSPASSSADKAISVEPLQEKVQAAAPELLLYGAAGVAAVGLTGLAVEVGAMSQLLLLSLIGE